MDDLVKWVNKHVFTVSKFGHAVMVACAIASYENIHTFFKTLHGSETVATALGVAVGAALVLSAALLSGMRWDWSNPRLQLIAGVTTLFALLSGGIQGASYASHGLWWLWAGLLGLALPVVGELGIALAVSAYEQEQREKLANMADDEVEARINAAVDSALVDVDMSQAKQDVEEAARKIVKSKLDALLARRIGNPLAQPSTDNTQASSASTSIDDDTSCTQVVDQIEAQVEDAVEEVVAASDAKLDEINVRVIEAVRNGFYTPYAIAKEVGVSQTTLKRRKESGSDEYIGRIPDLVAAGVLHNSSGANGNEYRLVE